MGIDISTQAIDVAAQKECYEKLLVCDLDKQAIPPELESERLIVFYIPLFWLDVIVAHIRLLKPQGVMIASISNVRYYTIVKDLFLKVIGLIRNWEFLIELTSDFLQKRKWFVFLNKQV